MYGSTVRILDGFSLRLGYHSATSLAPEFSSFRSHIRQILLEDPWKLCSGPPENPKSGEDMRNIHAATEACPTNWSGILRACPCWSQDLTESSPVFDLCPDRLEKGNTDMNQARVLVWLGLKLTGQSLRKVMG